MNTTVMTEPHPQPHDSHSPEDIQRHVKVYLLIGLCLLLGTALTVGAYYVHFTSVVTTITVALCIASVKAGLVAAYFMHLISEKRMIYVLLVFTGFFFLGLMLLTVWAAQDYPMLPAR
ncbi:MAG: cytochrome C oxidase subunit IV family protein [Verrucomicrobia bacterium]|nr:cytochrome C oxidase subunit IV family protein [Verrucomicrobiota bacterium]